MPALWNQCPAIWFPRMLLDKCVPVELRPGTVLPVVTIQQAAETLLQWPKTVDTAKQIKARKAVLASLQSMHSHAERVKARKAFEAAAKEAGILRPG